MKREVIVLCIFSIFLTSLINISASSYSNDNSASLIQNTISNKCDISPCQSMTGEEKAECIAKENSLCVLESETESGTQGYGEVEGELIAGEKCNTNLDCLSKICSSDICKTNLGGLCEDGAGCLKGKCSSNTGLSKNTCKGDLDEKCEDSSQCISGFCDMDLKKCIKPCNPQSSDKLCPANYLCPPLEFKYPKSYASKTWHCLAIEEYDNLRVIQRAEERTVSPFIIAVRENIRDNKMVAQIVAFNDKAFEWANGFYDKIYESLAGIFT